MRFSKQRENIRQGLEEHCIHPTAEELYRHLKPNNQNLSIATVYRNLNQLASIGQIKKIEGLSGQVHYDHNTFEHFHIICENCGKIIDLDGETAASLKKVLKSQEEFEIISYDIIVRGLCSECRVQN